MKIQNTTLVAGITNKGYMCFQIFNKGIKSADFLGFMSNLTHSLRTRKGREGRQRSLLPEKDQMQETEWFVHKRTDKDYVYVMDNAKQHVAKMINQQLLQYHSIQFLPPYTPHLNVSLPLLSSLLTPFSY
jgi:transposase